MSRRLPALIAFAALCIAAISTSQPAGATTVQRVVSPGGIEAWLVNEPSLPLVALNFAFVGGAANDPTDKPGVGYMVSSLLDEGAGGLNANAYHQQLEDAIDAVLDDVIAKGVTADEVERAKNRLIADAIYAQDSQATMARWYGASLTTGSTVESVQTWPDRIRAVTADAVNAAAKTWLDKRRSVTGYLVKDVQHEEKKT